MKPFVKVFRFLLAVFVVIFAALAIEPGLANAMPDYLIHALKGSGGIAFAATAAAQTVTGTVETGDVATASSNLLRPEISQIITKIRPDVFPMDTILREVGNLGSCDSRQYKYYSTDVRGVQDTVSVAYVFAATATADLEVTNIHIWVVDDVAFFPEVVNGDSKPVRAQVLKIDTSTNKITVKALNGVDNTGANTGDYMPAVAQNKTCTRIGNAKAETAAQATPYANMPSDTYNYVQIFMAQVEESFVNLQHKKEVEYNINDYRTDAIYDMRRQAELAMLFGYPKYDFYDPISDTRKDFLGGAQHFITKSVEYHYDVAGVSSDFNSWARQIFTGNNGSYKRILFGGNYLIQWLMNIPSVEKQLEANKSEIVAGIKFKVIETYFGDLLVRRHQSFDDVTGYTYNGLVLDLENVERRIREATHIDELNLDKTGVRRVKAFRIIEAWTMAWRNPLSHCWILGHHS